MKIALLTDGLYPDVIGGMQKHSVLLAQNLARKGVHVELYYTAAHPSAREAFKIFSAEEKAFIHEVFVPFPEKSWIPGHYIRCSKAYSAEVFYRLKMRPPVDLIYAQGFTGWYGCVNKPSWLKVPVAVNLHGLEMFQKSFGLRSLMEQLMLQKPAESLLRQADFVYSLGGRLTPILQRFVPSGQIMVQSIGIDASWIADDSVLDQAENEPCRFIFIGRNEPRKGLDLLSAVMRKKQSKEFEFHLVGPVEEKHRLSQSNIIYHGTISTEPEMKRLLDRCHVLICPSYSEGMPTVILEAMSRGLTVIATDVGAVSELVNEETGWLIKAGEEAQLEQAIEAALARANRIAKQHNARSLIDQSFTWDKVIEATISGFNQMLSSGAGSPNEAQKTAKT